MNNIQCASGIHCQGIVIDWHFHRLLCTHDGNEYDTSAATGKDRSRHQ